MALSTSRRGGDDGWLSCSLFGVAVLALVELRLTGLAIDAVWMTSRERVRPEVGESVTEFELGGRSGEGGRELLVGGAEGLSFGLGAGLGR